MVKWEVYKLLTARQGDPGDNEPFAYTRTLLHFNTKGINQSLD